ncbi:TPA: inovirus-type Gp2 protein [Escherichia coli]|nr:inovirus-type Gp2 protein [Escherichia coli]
MYNANPNYEMNFTILKDVNEHMEALFQRFSKLLPFRIDFAYRKDTPSFGHSCKHSMCIEIYRLLSETQTMLAGYYWVMEYTPDKGLHIHFIGYLDGQRHKNSYQISRQLGDIWRRITEGEGYFHLCRAKDKYPVRIDHVIHYSDKSAVDDLRYALSYLAKQDQKEHGIILRRSRLSEKSNRGRPRLNSILPGICSQL